VVVYRLYVGRYNGSGYSVKCCDVTRGIIVENISDIVKYMEKLPLTIIRNNPEFNDIDEKDVIKIKNERVKIIRELERIALIPITQR